MSINPLVSIIIPVYNGANYLREAIDSALAQTYKNIEIIVVNDGSGDDGETEKIALSYGDKIRYFCKENGGSSSALNYGIQKMSGQYFSWLSHDDVYMPDKIEKQIEKINYDEYKKQIIICNGKLIDKNGNLLTSYQKPLCGEFTNRELLAKLSKGYSINGCGVLISKQTIDEVGLFDESFSFINDFDYWYRLIAYGCHFSCINESLIKTRIHSEQVSVKKAYLFKKECCIMSRKILGLMFKDIKTNKSIIDEYLKISSKNGELEVIKDAMKYLKEQGYPRNVFKIYVYFLYGRIIRFLKEVYKKLFFRR